MAEGKRQSIATKSFIGKDGDETRHATRDSRQVKFTFSDGSEIVVGPEEIDKSLVRACTLYGMAQKIGDAYSGAGKEDNPVEAAKERAGTVLDNLKNGVWVTAREGGGGPRVSMLVEAVVAAAEAAGKTGVDPAKVKEKLKDDKTRKGAMQNPAVVAQYERIKAERAAARAAEAEQTAQTEGADLSALV